MSKIVWVFTTTLLLASGLGYFYYRYATSPEYSLLQMNKAIQEHDITAFEKYVDLKTLTGNLLDVVLDDVEKTTLSTSKAERLGQDLAKGLVSMMRPQVEEIWTQQIQKLVETGETDHSREKEKGNFTRYWKKVDSVSFQKITSVKIEGKIAWVGLEYFYPRFDTALVLDVKMRDKGSYWQLFDVPHIRQYINRVDSLETVRVDRLNAEVREAIIKTLQVSKIDLRIQSEGYYFITKYLVYQVEFENISDKVIKDLFLNYRLVNAKGTTLATVLLYENSLSLLPGDKHIIHEKEYLGYGTHYSINNPQAILDSGDINFTDGSALKWNSAWEAEVE